MSTPSDQGEAIVDAALDLPVAERAAYLDKVCGDNPPLRQLVEALLRAHGHAPAPGSPRAPSSESTAAMSLPLSEKPGDRIGPYKLLQQIGEGGCGVVYMAEQEVPVRRRVALKVIKLGMDTKNIIARFEAERQALALMDHPNIAKVFEAGASETGRPFFVMELVRGIKITDYCDQINLHTEARLELFIQVCKAVQHAHQKGIIHRDIKPSNILVTLHDGVPVPKVIDFGIAKATEQRLTDKTLFTALEQFIGTPAYMSPEQAEMSGLDIDTRSDIYSLGVLLYELLTGQMPFNPKVLMAAGLDEMRRIIREQDPVRPSTRLSSLDAADQTTVARRRQVAVPKLVHLVRGDLDWIVMKCLEKDRTRRYETANGLARDLERHLGNEPVVACPPSAAYRFQKLVRRNKLIFAAGGAVAAALLLGLAGVIWEWQQARTEATKSQQVAHFLEEMLQGVGPSVALGRDTKLLRDILEKTAERVGKELTNQPAVEAELLHVVGEAYCELGEYDKAKSMHTNALALRERSGRETLEVAASLDDLAAVLWRQSKLSEAETMQRQALQLRKKLQRDQHPDFASPLTTLAQILSDEGKLPEAERVQRQALALRQRHSPAHSPEMAEALKVLASILFHQKRLDEAEVLDRSALKMERSLLGNDNPEMAMTINDLATVLFLENRFPEAEASFREAVSLTERLLSPDHPARLSLLANLATFLGETGHYAEAEKRQRELLEARRRVLGPKHQRIAESLSNLARLLEAQHRLDQAEAAESEALAMRKELLGDRNIDVAVSLNHLTTILQGRKKLAEAEKLAREVLQMHRDLLGPDHRDVAGSLYNLASVLFDREQFPEAEQRARECRDLYEKILPNDWRKYCAQGLLGAALFKQKRLEEAEPQLLSACQGLKERQARIPAMSRRKVEVALARLVELYQTTGRPDQAELWQKELKELEGGSGEKPTPP